MVSGGYDRGMFHIPPALIQSQIHPLGESDYISAITLLLRADNGGMEDPMHGLLLLRAAADKGYTKAITALRHALPKMGDPAVDDTTWYQRLTAPDSWSLVEDAWRDGAWRKILMPQMASGGVIGGTVGGTGRIIDFNFSQVKVRRQPPTPPYPIKAKLAGIQGVVAVELTINPNGEIVNAVAKEGPEELRDGAVEYAKQWTFEPCTLNGKPQYGRFLLRLTYKLNALKDRGN